MPIIMIDDVCMKCKAVDIMSSMKPSVKWFFLEPHAQNGAQ
jgi:hypothetical protein